MYSGHLNKRFDIELIRVFCVVIVVLYHTVTRIYGSEYAPFVPGWLGQTMTSLIWFAVPMFLFISGFLFNRKVSGGYEHGDYIQLIKRKVQQLLLPYLIVSTLLMLQGNFFSATALLRGDFWHLWFLPALFLCFVVFYPLVARIRTKKYCVTYEVTMLVASFLLSFVKFPLWLHWGGLHNFFMWSYYFLLGCVLAGHANSFFKYMSRYYLWVVLLAFWLVDRIFFPVNYLTVSWHNMLGVSAALVSTLYLIGGGNIVPGKLPSIIVNSIFVIGAAGLWIYVLHYWILIYTTSSTALRIADKTIGFEANPVLIVVGIALVTFIVSFGLTWLYFRAVRRLDK